MAALSSPVEIGAQGTLMSGARANPTGFRSSNVTNAGVLVVSQAATSTISGNYVQQGNGRLARIAGVGAARERHGHACPAATSTCSAPIPTTSLNSHTDVLTADGGLTGTFSALDTAPSVTC